MTNKFISMFGSCDNYCKGGEDWEAITKLLALLKKSGGAKLCEREHIMLDNVNGVPVPVHRHKGLLRELGSIMHSSECKDLNQSTMEKIFTALKFTAFALLGINIVVKLFEVATVDKDGEKSKRFKQAEHILDSMEDLSLVLIFGMVAFYLLYKYDTTSDFLYGVVSTWRNGSLPISPVTITTFEDRIYIGLASFILLTCATQKLMKMKKDLATSSAVPVEQK